MRIFRDWSLRTKIAVTITLLLGLLSLATLFVLEGKVAPALKRELIERGIATSEDFAARSVDPLLTQDLFSLYELMQETLESNRDIRYAYIIDATGNIVVHSFKGGFPADLRQSVTPSPGEKYAIELLSTEEGLIRDIAVPIYGGKAGVAHVGISETYFSQKIADIRRWLLIATGGVFLLGFLAAYSLAELLTRPISRLVEATRIVAKGDFRKEVAVEGSDEIGQLGTAFNAMTRQLDSSQEQLLRHQQQLSALNELAFTLSTSLNLEEILHSALEGVLSLIGLKAGWVFLLTDNGKRLALAATAGISEEFARKEASLELDRCIRSRVLQTQHTEIIEDLLQYPWGDKETLEQEELRCILSVPLKSRTGVVGIMNVASGTPRQFTSEELQLLSAIGHQIGMAIENARLYEQARKQLAELQAATAELMALQKAIFTLNNSQSLDEVSQAIVTGVHLGLGYQRVTLALVDEQSRKIKQVASVGHKASSDSRDYSISEDNDLPAFACSSEEPAIIRNIPPEEPASPGMRPEPGMKVMACIPIRAKNKTLGWISVDSSSRKEPFKPEEISSLSIFADQAAIAIERARLWQELKQREERRGDFLKKIITAQEEERKRIARELHDETGQLLTSLILGLKLVESSSDAEESRKGIAELRALTQQTFEEVRRLALQLRPSVLDNLGLVPALEAFIKECAVKFGGDINLEVRGLDQRLPGEVEITLYRVVQEALTNVSKHAEATHAQVLLERRGASILAIVEDNGKGFDPERVLDSSRKSLGLLGIQERVSLLGGRFQLHSEPGKGTKIMVEVPLVAGGD
jgi:signal transduction histidine kinase